MRKIVVLIIILSILLLLLGYYYYQRNVYSREILKLEILGPSQAQAFEEVEYLVRYKNNGNITLEEATLIFQYPGNSLSVDNEERQRVLKALEDIYPGEERTISFKARLVGRENETKTAQATLRYRPKNLKAFYEAKTSSTSKILSLPLTLEIDLPSRVEAGKEIQFSLNYFSNSDWPVSDLRIKMEYPQGFEFFSSRPKALAQTEWDLPLLNKAEGGRIEIRGKLLGEVRDQKTFRATLGLWQQGEFILLKTLARGTEILKPALSIIQQINGSLQHTASPGDVLHYEIFFRNIGDGPFQELFLVSTLDSPAFDFDTLRTEFGQFNRGDNFVMWDWREIPKLRFLGPGEEGKVEFWVTLKRNWSLSVGQDKNFSLRNRVVLSQVREEFETKINSLLEVAQRGYFADEVFGNSGPLPPQVGRPTTYTITWQAKNYYNDVKNVTLRATLGPNVKLTGKMFPADAPITFDSQSKEVVWSIGDMAAGQGIRTSVPNVSFQVELTPDVSQAGKTPEIIGSARISGEDDWTQKTLIGTSPAIDTSLSHDPTVTSQQGIVQQ